MEKQITDCITSLNVHDRTSDASTNEQLIVNLKQENEKLKEIIRKNKMEYQLRDNENQLKMIEQKRLMRNIELEAENSRTQQKSVDLSNVLLREENERNSELLGKARNEITQLKNEIIKIKLQWQAEDGKDSWSQVKDTASSSSSISVKPLNLTSRRFTPPRDRTPMDAATTDGMTGRSAPHRDQQAARRQHHYGASEPADNFTKEFVLKLLETYHHEYNDNDVRVMMEKLGQPKNHIEIRKMIKEIDLNGSGTINFKEFVQMMLGGKSSIMRMILMFEEKTKEKEKPVGPPPKKSFSDLP